MAPWLQVFLYALITAVATWFGALPFIRKKKLSKDRIAKAHAIAAALMITASFWLIYEWLKFSWFGWEQLFLWITQNTWWVVVGLLIGLVSILLSDNRLHKKDISIGDVHGADAKKILLIVGIMTIHSFTEGVALWVSFGPSVWFWVFITLAIALHNIPEWLAISTVMVSKWVKRWKAGLWSIFSSLPQPLMAIPAFLFVNQFAPFLPLWLGFAAGAMLRMSLCELLPEALEWAPRTTVATVATLAIAGMILFQQLIGG